MRSKPYQNLYSHPAHGLLDVLRWQVGRIGRRRSRGRPDQSQPRLSPTGQPPGRGFPEASDPERIKLTWIGHSTFLIQHRGRNILTDPIFGNCNPRLPFARLRRLTPPAMTLESLPRIHDVVISHNHYDHLDATAIQRLGDGPNYWVPAGLTEWFHRRGIRRCRQLEWWASAELSEGVTIHCVPSQHFAARGLFDRNRTHWCGWVVRSRERTVYFAGDTGYCPVFREIGERFGGFDLAMIPIGAYRPRWLMRPMHVDPYEAVEIHLDLRSRQSVACHWGTFALTDEPQDEPPRLLGRALAERLLRAESFLVLRSGGTLEV